MKEVILYDYIQPNTKTNELGSMQRILYASASSLKREALNIASTFKSSWDSHQKFKKDLGTDCF